MFNYEKLHFYHDARTLVKELYLLTASFPESEKFNLTSQIRRAAVSVTSNIAEGTSSPYSKDIQLFLAVAGKSCAELGSQLDISLDLGYVYEDKYLDIKKRLEIICRQIYGYRKAIKTSNN